MSTDLQARIIESALGFKRIGAAFGARYGKDDSGAKYARSEARRRIERVRSMRINQSKVTV